MKSARLTQFLEDQGYTLRVNSADKMVSVGIGDYQTLYYAVICKDNRYYFNCTCYPKKVVDTWFTSIEGLIDFIKKMDVLEPKQSTVTFNAFCPEEAVASLENHIGLVDTPKAENDWKNKIDGWGDYWVYNKTLNSQPHIVSFSGDHDLSLYEGFNFLFKKVIAPEIPK